MRDIIQKVLREYTENLIERSTRVKLHPRTQADLEYMSDVLYTAWKEKDDKEPKKGEIYVEDTTGDYAMVPIYYLSEFENQAAVFPINNKKDRNLYNVFIVVSPDGALVPTRKSIYNVLYHEIQHLMDLNTTSKISQKKIGNYDTSDDKSYYGHPFEFRAYANEVLEGIVREYKELIGRYSEEELLNSVDTLLDFFAKSGQGDDILKKVMFSVSSEEDNDEDLPHVIHLLGLLKIHNPKQWKDFLTMLFSTVNEIKDYIKQQYRYEVTEITERKMSKSYCESTSCREMGFSQKASCRPYKNCYSK
jgi:hypothetical protein|tara:strand:+ start:2929 stop:3843 length:915 start_codon:yes stop_codon:yes gene_type:complete